MRNTLKSSQLIMFGLRNSLISLKGTRTLTNYTRCCQQQRDKILSKNPTTTGHFKDEDDWTSVQERQVFDKIFEELASKQEMRHRNSQEILHQAQVANNNKNRKDGVHVVFGKKKEELSPQDQKLKDFLESTGRKSKDTAAKITKDDIRLKPVSLIEQTEDKPSILPNLNSKFNEETLHDLKSRIQLKATLDTAMKPFINGLVEKIETDYDFFQVVKELITVYLQRDQQLDIGDQLVSKNLINQIETSCIDDPHRLPAPYQITLPFTLVKLLTVDELNFPSYSKYTIASYIYQECKKSSDVSLYLNVCDVDFYNVLLQLSWDNFREINQLKQYTAEMSINGIMGDLYTVEMLDKICYDLRYLNDDIPDEETTENIANQSAVGVVWCRENALQLNQVETYLTRLKESLA
ncbi:hypothetical protein ZYGR_0H00550 [Zygosaccharomyces rouxii]|uniref:Mtf2-like C-terminal domain-containing protein n=1 Tax=Zygosaccharomyces rouxii TaxID=4956 RepID=A0A1Q2ZV21_ZYGRO|nr:hypothetical protein ZYGR_0H00550 [Zygosaccharomyces rouxii]